MSEVKEEYVKWSDSLSMRVSFIDHQHKALLELINELYGHLRGNEEEKLACFQATVKQLALYAKNHFADEEKMMLRIKFPDYSFHKKTHDDFVETVSKTIRDFEDKKFLVIEKLAVFLKEWVLTHIAGEDKKYSDYLCKIATRKASGKLTITPDDVKAAETSSINLN